jgi:hypothetical protein
VESEGERGHDPEVPAATAQRPEQVRVLLRRRGEDTAVGRHDLGLHEVVAAQAVLGVEVAVSTTEGQAGHTGLGHPTQRCGEPERLGLAVDVAEQRAALDVGQPTHGVDLDPPHRREVDEHAVADRREPAHGVPASADTDEQAVLAREGHRVDDVGRAGAPCGDGRAVGVHRVPRLAGLGHVLRAVLSHHGATEVRPELLEHVLGELFLCAVRPHRRHRHRAVPDRRALARATVVRTDTQTSGRPR